MPSLWIINQSYYPDIDATGQMMTDLAEDLVKNGLQVAVITGQNQKSQPKHEQHNGVNISRVSVARLNKKVLFYRYLNYLSLFPSILIKVLFMPKPDCIFIVSSPPFMFLLGWLLKIIKGSKLIFNVQDLYPDIAIKLRLIKNPLLINSIKWLVLQSYKRADKLICVGEKMRDLLIKRGVLAENISIIHNWADSKLLYPIEKAANPFFAQPRLAGKFIIQYSGNIGMVHEIDTILLAAKALARYPVIHFLFIGGGVQVDNIKEFIKNNKLSNITLLPFQPRKDLNLSLNASDISVVSMKAGFEGTIVPSKIFGIMAVGKPVLAICHADSELANIIEKYDCGAVIRPGDTDGLVEKILLVFRDKAGRLAMGGRARQALVAEYDRSLSTNKYFTEIQKLQARSILPPPAPVDAQKGFAYDLSICTVNHNAKEFAANCIRSIYDKTKSISFEIIMVDNGSSDGSPAAIARQFPNVMIIENKTNAGFARANNQAIERARGKYIFLLNNDTVLKNNAIEQMVAFFDRQQSLGLLTCKLYEADGKTVQRNCRTFPTPPGTMFGRASLLTRVFPKNPWSSKNLLSDWDYNSVREIDWASGAALMVRRSVIDQVGLLDDKNFFIYWEDTDWCKRIHDAGWKIAFIPDAEIIHLTGSGGGKRSLFLSNRMIYQMHKSAYNYFRKHYLKSIFNPMTLITFIGFISLTAVKVTLNTYQRLIALR